MSDKGVQLTRGLGWILFVVGLLAAAGTVVWTLFNDPDVGAWGKFILAASYGGLALLLISVLRQRLIERRSDRYKDVEI